MKVIYIEGVFSSINNFTGIGIVMIDKSIRYFKNGKLHRKNKPASIYRNGHFSWWINNQLHRENGPAYKYTDGTSIFYYKGKDFGRKFTIQSWKEKVKELKYLESLEIFK